MPRTRFQSESDSFVFTRSAALMVREVEDDDADGYADFDVRLSSDFRRPLWRSWDGMVYETLVHTADALDTSFVDAGMSFVQARSHYSGDRPGRILEKSIKFAKEGDLTFADARVRIIDDGASGEAMIKRWRGLVDRNLSIDYMWRSWTEEYRDDTDDIDIVVDDWRMLGVSAVGIPADENAGVASEREIKLLTEVLQMSRDNPTGGRVVRVTAANPNDPPADPQARDNPPADPPADPPTTQPDDNPPADPQTRNRREPPDDDPPARRSYTEQMEEMQRDFDAAVKEVYGDAAPEESLMRKLREEVLGEARGRLNHGETYESGTAGVAVYQYLAKNREAGLREDEEFSIQGGELKRDHTKSKLVRCIADTVNHINRSAGPNYDLNAGAIQVALGQTSSRNAGAHQDYQAALLGTMEPQIRSLMYESKGAALPPDMYLRMLRDNERGVSKEAKERITKVLDRAFSVTGASGGKGGALVDTDVLVEEFTPALYASAHTSMLGVSTFMGLTSNISIPIQTSKINVAWYSENGAIALSDTNIGAVTTAPHRVGASSDVSHMLSIQTGGAADGIVEGVIFAGLDEALDIAYLTAASGGDDPTGILNISGIHTNNVSLAAAGRATRFQAVLGVITALTEADVPEGYRASLAAEAIKTLKATPKDTTGGSGGYIMEGGMICENVPAFSTSILSADTANDEFMIVSDWQKSYICTYGVPFLIEDVFTGARTGEKRLTLQMFWDHVVTQAVRFSEAVANAV